MGGWTPPIGYVWLTVDNVSPATYFENTVWELISQNRVLMGAGDGHEGGDTEEAGLPNITGRVAGLYNEMRSEYGALYYGTMSLQTKISSSAWEDGKALYFDASRSNSIYGNSSTVQPPAYYVYIWRRAS